MTIAEQITRLVGNLLDIETDRPVVAEADIDAHLIAVMILLATREDVLEKVYPKDRETDPEALYCRGVDRERVKPHLIKRLRKYQLAFATLQFAWLDLTGYTDPPCLGNFRMDKLVQFTRSL
jgi:hypothetical protein